MVRAVVVATMVLWLGAAPARAQGAEPYATGLAFPTNMAFAPDGRLFFTEKQTGNVRIIETGGRVRPDPFVTLDVDGRGETGLLGIALHPGFDRGQPWVYLYVSDPNTGMNTIVRVRADGDTGGSPQVLLETVPGGNAYHNGGELLFGPDGMLYASVGEAHESARAQDLGDLGGKVLRLTPAGHPAPGDPFGKENPVYTLGHRNSFGLCADRSGVVWETENGPERDDEVNRLEPGGNYGWPEVMGAGGDGTFVDPISVFEQPIAITGCAWWDGELFVGSYNDGRVRRIDPASGDAETFARFGAGVTDLLVGPDDMLYVATADAIWRLAPGSTPTDGPGGPIEGSGARSSWRTWVALGTAGVLALALLARLWAGRRLRDET